MSHDDKRFMAQGHYVRHTYKKRGKSHPVCERCGVKRRATSSGWEYFCPSAKDWVINNPPCVLKQPEQSDDDEGNVTVKLHRDDLQVLSFFFLFAGPFVDATTHGYAADVRQAYPNLVDQWHKFSDILQRCHAATPRPAMTSQERQTAKRMISRMVKAKLKAKS